MYWGRADGEYRDREATVPPKSGFFAGFGAAEVVTIGVHGCNRDGLPDLLLGGYDAATLTKRGMQLLVNAGRRNFVDETRTRIGDSAWSATEAWQERHRFFDFNGDGTVDIVPTQYAVGSTMPGANVLAWLGDGACGLRLR